MGRLLGEKLTLSRVERGMSVPDLSDATKISLSHIHRIEDGDREPSYKMLVRLAEALGVSVAELNAVQMMDKGFVETGVPAEDDDPRSIKDIRKKLNGRLDAMSKADLARLLAFVDAYFPSTPGESSGDEPASVY